MGKQRLAIVVVPFVLSIAWGCGGNPSDLTSDARNDLRRRHHEDAGLDAARDAEVVDSGVVATDAGSTADAAALPARTTTLVIDGASGATYRGLKISTTTGDCVQIVNSTNVTIEDSDIGPCGGNGVSISGGSGARIYDSYIHPETSAASCCDTHDGVLTSNTSNVIVQGNVIAYGESNVEAQIGSSQIAVVGNFLLNPRGPFPRGQNFQASLASNVTVSGNYALSSTDTAKYLFAEVQEDSINFWRSQTFTVANNYITGGRSPSGCGVMIDDRSNYGQVLGNELYDTGQCGIGVADGVGHTIDGNKVLNLTPVANAGDTAIYVWNQYTSNALGCGGTGTSQITISNNVATELKPDMTTHSGWWNGGGCDPLYMANNVFDAAAYAALYPAPTHMPPPAIPPSPKSCAARSPYTTQTSAPPCP